MANASKRDASRASRRGCSCEAVRSTAWFGGVFIMLMRDFGLLPPVPDLPIFFNDAALSHLHKGEVTCADWQLLIQLSHHMLDAQ